MLVSEAVGAALATLGADTVFGVVGSGNFHVTNALIANGARFVAARHECGAACAADAWARGTGRPGILSVHQGPGLTNALTGITEAAKSRTPLLVLAADVAGAAVRSNFRIDVAALAASVGATADRLYSPATAVADAARAYRTAERERRTVVLAMPLDVQAAPCDPPAVPPAPALDPPAPAPAAAARLAGALGEADRPVFVAGRGARAARASLEQLADACGALLATSAVAKGLFHDSPWDLGVSGGFASPLAAELISAADLVVGWGCSLNMWTMRHGKMIGPGALVAQVDDDSSAIGAHRPVDIGVHGDVAETARMTLALLNPRPGYRSPELRSRIAAGVRWRDVPYADEGAGGRIDPRTLTIALDDLLPPERVVAIDSGNFMGYPSMFLSVPDERGFCFTQAYQSIGLGLASVAGSRPRRRRRADGHQRTGDRGAVGPAHGCGGVRRRGLRRRGSSLRSGRVRAGHGPVPARRHRRHRPRVRLRGGHRARPGRPRAGPRLAGRPTRPPAGHRREGGVCHRLLVAGGGVPRPLNRAARERTR